MQAHKLMKTPKGKEIHNWLAAQDEDELISLGYILLMSEFDVSLREATAILAWWFDPDEWNFEDQR